MRDWVGLNGEHASTRPYHAAGKHREVADVRAAIHERCILLQKVQQRGPHVRFVFVYGRPETMCETVPPF